MGNILKTLCKILSKCHIKKIQLGMILLLIPIFAKSSLLKHWSPPEVPHFEKQDNSIQPNEKYPKALQPLIKGSVPGVYVAVGTERGFIGGSLRNETKGIILVDFDSDVYLFNSINVGLLVASQGHSDYRKLRLTSDINEWVLAAQRIHFHPLRELMLSPSTYQWWIVNVRGKFNHFHRPSDRNWKAFFKTNYLFEEFQYRRLKRLADQGRILPIAGDLKNRNTIEKIREILEKEGEYISVLDLSNAWWPKFLSVKGTEEAVLGLMNVMQENSKLILTTNKDIDPKDPTNHWKYFGSHVRNLYPTRQMSFYEFLHTFFADYTKWGRNLRKPPMDPHLDLKNHRKPLSEGIDYGLNNEKNGTDSEISCNVALTAASDKNRTHE